jgi:DNA repair ATPase RecN
MKLSASNFQSWENFTLDLDKKLSVLIGPSDAGKSAVFRALMGLVRNEIEADQIRVGTDATKVTLEVPGHSITIRRSTKSSNVYEIDGKPYTKSGGEIPEQVQRLNMGVIQIGDTRLDPIFSGQHDSKFMLQDVGPTQMNAILGAFSSTEKLEMGKREANTRISQKNQEAKSLSTEVNEAETRKHTLLKLYSDSTPIMTDVDTLEYRINRAETLLQAYKTTVTILDRLAPLQLVISGVTIPELGDIVVLEDTIEELEKSLLSMHRSALLAVIIDQSSTVIQLWDNLYLTYKKISHLYNSAELLSTKKLSIDGLIFSIDSCVSKIDNGLEEFNDTRVLIKYLRQAAQSQEVVSATEVSMESYNSSLSTYEQQIEVLESQLEEERRQAEMVTCPKCGTNFCIHEE